MDFVRGQNTLYFSKYDFGPVKLPGLSRNGPQVVLARVAGVSKTLREENETGKECNQ